MASACLVLTALRHGPCKGTPFAIPFAAASLVFATRMWRHIRPLKENHDDRGTALCDRAGHQMDQHDESAVLLEAFGKENSTCDFDWDANYGCGFSNTADMRVVPIEQCERIKT